MAFASDADLEILDRIYREKALGPRAFPPPFDTEQDPVMDRIYPQKHPSMPIETIDYTPAGPVPAGGFRITPESEPVPTDFGGETDYSRPELKEIGPKSGWKRFAGTALRGIKQYGPDILRGALTAGATPNIAGGGPTDIIRAAAVGMAVPAARRAQERAAKHQERMEEAEVEKKQAEIDKLRQHAELYKKQAAKKYTFDDESYDAVIKAGGTPQQALIVASGGTLQDKASTPPKPAPDKAKELREQHAVWREEADRLFPKGSREHTVYSATGEVEAPQKPQTKPPTEEEKELGKARARTWIATNMLGLKPGTPKFEQYVGGIKPETPERPEKKKNITPVQLHALAVHRSNSKDRATTAFNAALRKINTDEDLTDEQKASLKAAAKQELADLMQSADALYEEGLLDYGVPLPPKPPPPMPLHLPPLPGAPIAPGLGPSPPPPPVPLPPQAQPAGGSMWQRMTPSGRPTGQPPAQPAPPPRNQSDYRKKIRAFQ